MLLPHHPQHNTTFCYCPYYKIIKFYYCSQYNIVTLCYCPQYNANVNVVDHENRNALWYARSSGSSECTELLTANGCVEHPTLPRRRGSTQPGKNDVFDKLPASVI